MPYISDEAEALALERLDQPLRLAVVVDGLPNGIDAGRQCQFRDDTPVPDCSQKIVLADHAVAVGDQVNQQVKGLRLKAQQNVAMASSRLSVSREKPANR